MVVRGLDSTNTVKYNTIEMTSQVMQMMMGTRKDWMFII